MENGFLRYWARTSVGLILTGIAVRAAYLERGFFAIGGEWFIFPAVWFGMEALLGLKTLWNMLEKESKGGNDGTGFDV